MLKRYLSFVQIAILEESGCVGNDEGLEMHDLDVISSQQLHLYITLSDNALIEIFEYFLSFRNCT